MRLWQVFGRTTISDGPSYLRWVSSHGSRKSARAKAAALVAAPRTGGFEHVYTRVVYAGDFDPRTEAEKQSDHEGWTR